MEGVRHGDGQVGEVQRQVGVVDVGGARAAVQQVGQRVEQEGAEGQRRQHHVRVHVTVAPIAAPPPHPTERKKLGKTR